MGPGTDPAISSRRRKSRLRRRRFSFFPEVIVNPGILRKVIAALVIVPFFLVCIFLLASPVLVPEVTFQAAHAQLIAYSSLFSGHITFILGYFFGSTNAVNGFTWTQLWMTLPILAFFVLGAAFLAMAPALWGFNPETYSLMFKAFEVATSGIIGVIAGFYFGR